MTVYLDGILWHSGDGFLYTFVSDLQMNFPSTHSQKSVNCLQPFLTSSPTEWDVQIVKSNYSWMMSRTTVPRTLDDEEKFLPWNPHMSTFSYPSLLTDVNISLFLCQGGNDWGSGFFTTGPKFRYVNFSFSSTHQTRGRFRWVSVLSKLSSTLMTRDKDGTRVEDVKRGRLWTRWDLRNGNDKENGPCEKGVYSRINWECKSSETSLPIEKLPGMSREIIFDVGELQLRGMGKDEEKRYPVKIMNCKIVWCIE